MCWAQLAWYVCNGTCNEIDGIPQAQACLVFQYQISSGVTLCMALHRAVFLEVHRITICSESSIRCGNIISFPRTITCDA